MDEDDGRWTIERRSIVLDTASKILHSGVFKNSFTPPTPEFNFELYAKFSEKRSQTSHRALILKTRNLEFRGTLFADALARRPYGKCCSPSRIHDVGMRLPRRSLPRAGYQPRRELRRGEGRELQNAFTPAKPHDRRACKRDDRAQRRQNCLIDPINYPFGLAAVGMGFSVYSRRYVTSRFPPSASFFFTRISTWRRRCVGSGLVE